MTGGGAISPGQGLVVNDLIRTNGNSLWGGGMGYYHDDIYPYKGVMALYKDVGVVNPEFHVLYVGERTQPSILVLQGTSGSPLSNSWLPNGQNNLLNGMVWEDPAVQDNIVFSGYMIDTRTIPPTPPLEGRPVLFSVDIAGPTLQWTRGYLPRFSMAAYQAVPLDSIVTPLHPVPLDYHNQHFYQPKNLVRGTNSYHFTAPSEDTVFNIFDSRFLNTDAMGNVDPDCMELQTWDDFDQFPIFTGSVAPNPHVFSIVGDGADVLPANVGSALTCALSPAPRSSMGNNETMGNRDIRVFPNPARDVLHVSGLSDRENVRIALHDLQGRIVLSQTHNKTGNETSLDVSALESGVYFLNVSRDGEDVFVEKIVKE